MRIRARALLGSLVLGLTLAASSQVPGHAAGRQGATVLVAEFDGAVTPVVTDHLRDVIEVAERDRHAAVVVRMDTPGGLDTAMREVVQNFLNSRVPVIVWVGPSGARAASAGAIIALSANVVAMARGTNIGAATPVTIEGAAVGDKITNDAAAYAVAIAQERGRSETFARDIVRKGTSEPATRAVRIGAADLLAGDIAEVLDEVDGTEVLVAGGRKIILRTADAILVEREMGWFAALRQRLADPNLAYLFLSLGTLAIIYELANPGVGFGGVAGVILLVLAMFAVAVLPVTAVGITLLVLAAGLFVAEIFAPGIGVFAAGGSVSLVLSALFLMRGSLRVDPAVFVPTAVVVGGAVVGAGRLAWRARSAVPTTGAESLHGRTATMTSSDGTTGRIFLEGTWWTARSPSALADGRRVRVTGVEGLVLIVEPMEEEP